MPKFETTLAGEGDMITITTDDPEVHAAMTAIDSAQPMDDAADRKRFQLPRRDAQIHFPHLLDDA
jgi:hypothetical protein